MEGWEIFTRNRGEARDGGAVGFAIGDDKYLKSLDIVERGVLTPLFYEDPSILPIPPFSNVVHPLLNFSFIFNPHLHYSFCCHVF